jgi:hypothetical protein
MDSQKLSYKQFQEKYQNIRTEVYNRTPVAIGMPGVRLTPINTEALLKYKDWPKSNRHPPNGGWDWEVWIAYYKAKHDKRFDAAIWYSTTLCGLCLGKLSEKNIHVRLEVLEGSTDKAHPLKNRVAYVALTAIELFGYAAGAEEARIIAPVSGAIPIYKNLGYTLHSGSKNYPQYLSKPLT